MRPLILSALILHCLGTSSVSVCINGALAATTDRQTFNLPESDIERPLHKKNWRQAAAILAGCKQTPQNSDNYKIYQAWILYLQEEPERATAILDQVKSFDNASEPALIAAGKALAQNRSSEKALTVSTIAYGRKHSRNSSDLRAAVLMQLKRYKEASDQYVSAARFNPRAASLNYCRAASVQLYDLHNAVEALKMTELAEKAAGGPDVTSCYSRGECYRALNRPKDALIALTEGLKLEKIQDQKSMEANVAYCNLYKARAAIYKQLGMQREAAADTRELDKLANEAADFLLHK